MASRFCSFWVIGSVCAFNSLSALSASACTRVSASRAELSVNWLSERERVLAVPLSLAEVVKPSGVVCVISLPVMVELVRLSVQRASFSFGSRAMNLALKLGLSSIIEALNVS
jgi:hypothetical protein